MDIPGFKKVFIPLVSVLLVSSFLQVTTTFARNLRCSRISPKTSSYQFIPAPNSENADVAESSIEICTQTLLQRSEFKKVYQYCSLLIFQVFSYHHQIPEIILKDISIPATPLYISNCTILI